MTHTGIVYAARVPFGNGTEWAWSCTCGKKYAGFREDERACRASGLEHQLTGRSGREIDERVSGGGIVTVQDARERAWQQERADRPGWWPRAQFDAGWDAAKREDEQRIAELVAALMETTAALGGAAEQIKALGSTPSENAVRAVERGIEQVRALAGEEG